MGGNVMYYNFALNYQFYRNRCEKSRKQLSFRFTKVPRWGISSTTLDEPKNDFFGIII
jgi:hypothetical protein